MVHTFGEELHQSLLVLLCGNFILILSRGAWFFPPFSTRGDPLGTPGAQLFFVALWITKMAGGRYLFKSGLVVL